MLMMCSTGGDKSENKYAFSYINKHTHTHTHTHTHSEIMSIKHRGSKHSCMCHSHGQVTDG